MGREGTYVGGRRIRFPSEIPKSRVSDDPNDASGPEDVVEAIHAYKLVILVPEIELDKLRVWMVEAGPTMVG